jgi:hypothetical protein
MKKIYSITIHHLITLWVLGAVIWIWALVQALEPLSAAAVRGLVQLLLEQATISSTFAVVLVAAIPIALIVYTLGWRYHRRGSQKVWGGGMVSEHGRDIA